MGFGRVWRKAAVALAALPAVAAAQDASPPAAAAPADQTENSGQDPTQPVRRLDLRLKLDDNPGGVDTQTFTLRTDMPFRLGGGWKLNTRLDIPLVRSNAPTPAFPDGHYDEGLGDMLLQALVIAPPMGRTAFAFGTQLILPTGSERQFTSGKYHLVPTVAVVQQLPSLSRGSFVALVVRDNFTFAGDDARADTNVFSVQPNFNWQLPNRWFVTLAPEIKFNTRDDWRVFVPFDITVGRKLNATTVMSLQVDIGLVDDYPQYDWQAEFRVGFFF